MKAYPIQFLTAVAVLASLGMTNLYAQDPEITPIPSKPVPTSDTPPAEEIPVVTNPLEPSDQLLNLQDSVKLVKVMDFRYNPSQRDPFISHEILSPFVTEEEIEDLIDEEAVKFPKQADIQAMLKNRIEILGISTGNRGGGYALATVTTTNETGDAAVKRERILKPGQTVSIPLSLEELNNWGLAMATWGWIGKPEDSAPKTLKLVTTQIHERYLNVPVDKDGNVLAEEVSSEISSAVAFRIEPAKGGFQQKAPFNEIFIHYKKDFSLNIDEE